MVKGRTQILISLFLHPYMGSSFLLHAEAANQFKLIQTSFDLKVEGVAQTALVRLVWHHSVFLLRIRPSLPIFVLEIGAPCPALCLFRYFARAKRPPCAYKSNATLVVCDRASMALALPGTSPAGRRSTCICSASAHDL